MSGLRDAIIETLYDYYGDYRDDRRVNCADAIMAIIIKTPEPKPQGASLGVAPRTYEYVTNPKRDTVAELLTDAKRELDDRSDESSVFDLRNAILAVIAAVEVLAK